MINKISFADNKKYYLNNAPLSVNSGSSSFTHSYLEHSDLTLKQKAAVLATSVFGMALPLAFWSKKAGFSLNPAKIFKTPVKDWALLKFKPTGKVLEYDDAAKIISIATGSVAGGFAGGVLVDKDKKKKKKREVLSQLLGDVIVPITCVWAGAKAFKHYEKTLQNIMPKIEDDFKFFGKKIARDSKFTNFINTISENIPNAFATLGSLAVGIIAGNKVSNEINEKLYHKKVERGIKATDFAPHVDDIGMAVSLMADKSKTASFIQRTVPLFFLGSGMVI